MDNRSKEVERWQGVIADLNKQRETAQARIEKLQERKNPVTLKAHTGGDKAREKLGALNAELLTERQGLEDLETAIGEGEAKLGKAAEALAGEREAENLRVLSRLAEERVKAAAVVDQQVQALARALGAYYGIGDQIYRQYGTRDLAFSTKINGRGRADAAVAQHLASLLPCVVRNAHDPRDGQSLEALEQDQLARLLLTPKGADKIAGAEPVGEPESERAPQAA